jgi:hypothetical protein
MTTTLDTRLEYEAALENYLQATGASRVVIRPDIDGGTVIAYTSTADYMLEARRTIDGRHAHRVNLDWYLNAADIPATYRKARAVAQAVESVNVSELVSSFKAVSS